ncbi:aldehyde dehydrogenase family protein [Castellaniella sp. WN]
MQIETYDCYIDGRFIPARDGQTLQVHDPADNRPMALIARGRQADIDTAVAAANDALPAWAQVPPAQRARILHAIAVRIRKEQARIARIECIDTGKPLKQAMADIQAAARYFEYFAGAADKILGSTIPMGPGYLDFTLREPLGVTAQIVPWNYPIQIASRGIAPALACGNTVVVKPAELACLGVLELARICHAEGVPPGVLNVVTGYGHEAGEALATHPDINLLVFTGSVATGIHVMQAAATNVVPVLLELGGKSPNILLPDADLDDALPIVLRSGIPNSGQTCTAGSRILVHRSIHRTVVERLTQLTRQLMVGPGVADGDLGALISRGQADKVQACIDHGKQEGASIIQGGKVMAGAMLEEGNFIMPTLLDHVSPGMRVFKEEIFGPVMSVISFDTLEEAASLANGTEYGLSAGIWGQNMSHTHWLAKQVKSGQVFINMYGVGGGAELPFGGYKKSGFGREKGMDALMSYTQVKNVCVRVPEPPLPLAASGPAGDRR